MVLALFFFGAGASGINCAFLDVSPRFSSTINTLGNTAGAVAGLLGPIVVSALVTAIDGIWGWRLVFLLTAGMGVTSLIIWAMYQTSDIVHELNTPAEPMSTLYNPLLNDVDGEDDGERVYDGRPSSQNL
jgi:MFS family permease